MNWPQYTIIAGLLIQIITILVMQYRVRQNPFIHHLPPRQRWLALNLWVTVSLPLGEAWVLYMGDFW